MAFKYKLFTSVLIMTAFLSASCTPKSEKIETWKTEFGDKYYSAVDNFALDSNGNIYTAGPFNLYRLRVHKLNKNGLLIKTLGVDSLLEDSFVRKNTPILGETQDISIGDDGIVYIVGSAHEKKDEQAFVSAVDKDGNLLWNELFGGKGDDIVDKITTIQNGHFYISGKLNNTRIQPVDKVQPFISLRNISGEVIWKVDTDLSVSKMVIDDNLGVYIGGYKLTNSLDDSFGVVRYMNREGRIVWERKWDINEIGAVSNMHMSIDRGLYVLAHTLPRRMFDNGYNTLFLLDKNGDVKFKKSNLLPDVYGSSLVERNDRNILIGGTKSNVEEGKSSAFLSAIDQKGNVIWEKFFSDNSESFYPQTGFDVVQRVVSNDDGNIYISGAINNKAFVMALDQNGDIHGTSVTKPSQSNQSESSSKSERASSTEVGTVVENAYEKFSRLPVAYTMSEIEKIDGRHFIRTDSSADVLPFCTTPNGAGLAFYSILQGMTNKENYTTAMHDKALENSGCLLAPEISQKNSKFAVLKVLENVTETDIPGLSAGDMGYLKLVGQNKVVMYAPKLNQYFQSKGMDVSFYADMTRKVKSPTVRSAPTARTTRSCSQFASLNFQTSGITANPSSLQVAGPNTVSVNISSNNSASLSTSGGYCLGGEYGFLFVVNTGFRQADQKSYQGTFSIPDSANRCDVYVDDGYANASCN